MAPRKRSRTLAHSQLSEMWDATHVAMASLTNVKTALLAHAPDAILDDGELQKIYIDNLHNSGIPNQPDTKPISHYCITFTDYKTIFFMGVHRKSLCTKILDDIAAIVSGASDQANVIPSTAAPHPGWDQVIN